MCVCVWCPVMDWPNIQDIFSPHAVLPGLAQEPPWPWPQLLILKLLKINKWMLPFCTDQDVCLFQLCALWSLGSKSAKSDTHTTFAKRSISLWMWTLWQRFILTSDKLKGTSYKFIWKFNLSLYEIQRGFLSACMLMLHIEILWHMLKLKQIIETTSSFSSAESDLWAPQTTIHQHFAPHFIIRSLLYPVINRSC